MKEKTKQKMIPTKKQMETKNEYNLSIENEYKK